MSVQVFLLYSVFLLFLLKNSVYHQTRSDFIQRIMASNQVAKSTKLTSKEQVRFVFEPDRNSPNGILLTWCLHHTFDGKEKVAAAARSFWLPFAYQALSSYSKVALQELAQQCIWRIEEQIQFLRSRFDLEKPIYQSTIAPPLESPVSPSQLNLNSFIQQGDCSPFLIDSEIDEAFINDFLDALG